MNIVFLLISLCFTTCLFGQDWNKSYGITLSKSNEIHKAIVLVFSDSYFFVPGIKFKKENWRPKTPVTVVNSFLA